MGHLIFNLLIFSSAIFLIAHFLPGVRIKNLGTAIVVAIVYSLLNFLLGWVLKLLALPFILLTFGLFVFVVNAFILWLTDKLIDDFEINGFGTTFIASILITIVSWLLRVMIY